MKDSVSGAGVAGVRALACGAQDSIRGVSDSDLRTPTPWPLVVELATAVDKVGESTCSTPYVIYTIDQRFDPMINRIGGWIV
jgi:hypothetical protein